MTILIEAADIFARIVVFAMVGYFATRTAIGLADRHDAWLRAREFKREQKRIDAMPTELRPPPAP